MNLRIGIEPRRKPAIDLVTTVNTMISAVEQELSYILLIELLAHQFAYPVRWIETQQEILNAQNTERIIEVGPSRTLINMFQHSAALFSARDDALALKRQYLSVVQNEDEICYGGRSGSISNSVIKNTDEERRDLKSSPAHGSESRTPYIGPRPAQRSMPAVTQSQAMHQRAPSASSSLADQDVSAKLILETIIAEKMARLGRQLTWNSTINKLAAGRSVIENEIIGDLEAEFEKCPENASAMDLQDLYECIQSQHKGRIGKVSKRLISRTLMSKLANSWNPERAREYLGTKWKLGSNRQDTVLLLATRASFGVSKLAEAESQILLDNAAKEHLADSEVYIEENVSTDELSTATVNPIPVVQPEPEVQYTGRTSHNPGRAAPQSSLNPAILELEAKILAQEQELQQLRAEHDEIYLAGIAGIFDARKARTFQSSWNWRREDRVRDYYGSRMSDLPCRLQECTSVNLPKDDNMDHEISGAQDLKINGRVNPTTGFHIDSWTNSSWQFDNKLTAIFHTARRQKTFQPTQQRPKKILLTGAGKDSIGQHLLIRLLQSGAHVVVGTSKLNKSTAKYFQKLYRSSGAPKSSLTVLPYNQGSRVDVEALVSYVYERLCWDLDLVIPFAAISQNGQSIENVDGQSELAHRIMLTNTLRLLGCVSCHKRRMGIDTNPAQVIVPLSPNHGEIGHDGLYAESKLGLESLLLKWHTEDWHPFLSICGAMIGWTTGTGLTKHQDALFNHSDEIAGQRISAQEMAACLFALTHPELKAICETQSILANFSGLGDGTYDFAKRLRKIREIKAETQEIGRRLVEEAACDTKSKLCDTSSEIDQKAGLVYRRANFTIEYPMLPSFASLMAQCDSSFGYENRLDRIPVIVGFGEVGPFGSSRTRWQMETLGNLSLDGAVELAWIMGFVECKQVSTYELQWVDCETAKPIADEEIRVKYLPRIMEGCGIRFLHDEKPPQQLYEHALAHDLAPFEAETDVAQEFKRQYGDKARISHITGSSKWSVEILQGADLLIPKPASSSKAVAGLIPQGWAAMRYGIPPEIIGEVDPATLYVLVCVAETLLSAGVTDFYEFYNFIHTSEVGNCLGSGLGGISSLGKMYKDQFQGETFGGGIQSNILQETFVNTAAAWVNMLILGANGPINTPVGACATSLESLDRGYDLISSGKAQVCVVGGYDDISREISMSFGRMKATVDVEKEIANGREPSEMSRPMTSSRAGFVESHGCGMQLLTSASLAIEMGLPIRGVLAFTGTAADGIGRSVPRPGDGVLSFAAELPSKSSAPVSSRLGRTDLSQSLLSPGSTTPHSKRSSITSRDSEEVTSSISSPPSSSYLARLGCLKDLSLQQRQPTSALQRALSTFNLTVNDIDVLCLHATSTPVGDANELEVLNAQLLALGYQPEDNMPMLATCQKGLLGHSKGAAGAWAVNSALQMLFSGMVPGNPTIDDVDPAFEKLDIRVCFPAETVQTDGLQVVSVTGFGFGQKGAQVMLVHPDRLWSIAGMSLSQEDYDEYTKKLRWRKQLGDRAFADAVYKGNMVQIKESPYSVD